MSGRASATQMMKRLSITALAVFVLSLALSMAAWADVGPKNAYSKNYGTYLVQGYRDAGASVSSKPKAGMGYLRKYDKAKTFKGYCDAGASRR